MALPHFKLQRRKFTPKLDTKFSILALNFKLQRRKFTQNGDAKASEKTIISNSSGGNLHRLSALGSATNSYFKLQRRKFTPSAVFGSVCSSRLFQTPAEEIYTALEILFFQAMNIWSLYSYPLNLDKQQRQFRIKHRICSVLQILAKALSAQFSKFQPKSIARFNDAKAAAVLPRRQPQYYLKFTAPLCRLALKIYLP